MVLVLTLLLSHEESLCSILTWNVCHLAVDLLSKNVSNFWVVNRHRDDFHPSTLEVLSHKKGRLTSLQQMIQGWYRTCCVLHLIGLQI